MMPFSLLISDFATHDPDMEIKDAPMAPPRVPGLHKVMADTMHPEAVTTLAPITHILWSDKMKVLELYSRLNPRRY